MNNKKLDAKQSILIIYCVICLWNLIIAGSREIIALGITLALVSLVLVIMSFLFLLFGVYRYQTSKSEIKIHKLNNAN